MNIVIFDTETTSLDKPFCYNIGYSIRTADNEILCEKEFIVEQIWHNIPLFSTAYYAEKRSIYVKRMKARLIKMTKFGYICQEMARDFKRFNVEMAFAYNSSFDEKVFAFNCDWFKCINPFDNIPVRDIRGFVHNFLINTEFYAFCEEHSLFTESGNYSTTAETIYKFLFNPEFTEEHTALSDSQIESEILFACVEFGANLNRDYPTKRSIKRTVKKTLNLVTPHKTYSFDYIDIRINKAKTEIKIK